jgi:lipopolysaccharide export system protein LptC
MSDPREPPNLRAGEPDLDRRRRDLDRWHSRSRSIHFWRRALPLVIVVIAIGLGGWIVARGIMARMSAPPKPAETGVIRMVNPRFYGRDTSNRAFVVGAGEAARDSRNPGVTSLQQPTVTLDAEGAAPTHIQAGQGVYRETQRSMDLSGGVQLSDGRGNSFATPRAVIDTKTGVVHGDQGVKGQGPLGQIAASSYGVYDSGKRIVFKGGVHAQIQTKTGSRRRK